MKTMKIKFERNILNLIPDQATNAQEFFETREAYAEFCRTFLENVQPDLEKQRQARQQMVIDASAAGRLGGTTPTKAAT